MKKQLFPVAVLFTLLVALILSTTGCSVTTHQVNATVYGAGTEQITAAAKLADQAIADIDKSMDIKVPGTIEAGKLLIGSDSVYPPLGFQAKVKTIQDGKEQESIEIVGLEVDLSRAIAKKLGLEPTFVTVNWSEVPSSLTEGRVDIVASSMVTSPELVARFGASDVYLAADLAICAPSNARLVDEASLAGKVVGVQSGSTAETVVGKIRGLGESRVYSHVLEALADLQAGKVDAVVAEQIVCQWLLSNDPTYAGALKITGIIKTGEGYAFWFNTDDQELLAAVNAALQELRRGMDVTPATTTSAPDATTTTVAETGTTLAATSTTALVVASKSVFQLIFEKWAIPSTATE